MTANLMGSKMYHNKLLTLMTGILLLTFSQGCSQQPKVVVQNPPKEKAKPEPQIIEDFDPMSLGDYELDIKAAKPSESSGEDIDKLLKGGQEVDTSRVQMATGYRVQLISTRDGDEARTVKRDAVLSFEENVYVAFDNPYYKVRIGDCNSRYEAEILQEKAVEKGFVEAWVVRTQVFVTPQKQTISPEDNPEKAPKEP